MRNWLRTFLARNGVGLSVYMLGAVALWVIVMIVLPQLFMLDFSFRNNWQQIDPSRMGGPPGGERGALPLDRAPRRRDAGLPLQRHAVDLT